MADAIAHHPFPSNVQRNKTENRTTGGAHIGLRPQMAQDRLRIPPISSFTVPVLSMLSHTGVFPLWPTTNLFEQPAMCCPPSTPSRRPSPTCAPRTGRACGSPARIAQNSTIKSSGQTLASYFEFGLVSSFWRRWPLALVSARPQTTRRQPRSREKCLIDVLLPHSRAPLTETTPVQQFHPRCTLATLWAHFVFLHAF